MKKVSLSGSLRENVGKKDAKKHRREGKVPCVLYGGKEQIHFTAPELNFGKLIFTPEVFEVKLDIEGKEYSAVLQDVQYHPVTDKVLHADFLEIIPGKQIIVGLPIKFEGTSPGVIRGGKMIKKMYKIRVKGLIEEMPDYLVIDISELEIGGSVKIRDIELDKLALLDPPNSVIVRVKMARAVEEVVSEEEEEVEGAETPEGEEGGAPAPKAEGEGAES
ncbi:MAG: 50S ribosomal protein L25 [Bacteroidetes bacterium]|nr:MAG: 50S ribosomal protein L25 [Bacteroidota bacterium]RLD46476.1 MAG: 50S ribosomal protein L25 [Bacteroidota bacterium]RLD72267.1 MAG: 50S ribosomal protein L25 [Bacteroidota bacterium]RLD88457.1 MAG: 50S ribosomal protein L25 [Bacteroidota bacterium]HHL57806.1 50S ribosomal protein L25/general stress protein Ctc [Bacteroidota bacterium]